MNNYKKLLALILSFSLLLSILSGCGKTKPSITNGDNSSISSTEKIDDSDDSSSENIDSSDESNLDSSDDSSSEDTDIDSLFDEIDDTNDFDFDFVTTQTFTFNKNPSNSGIRGIGGVLPCWWYFPDSAMGGYTEAEIRVQVEQLKNMDVQIVRALSFQPGYAWDEEKGQYDWDSVYMKAFYQYADLMKENGIEIVINPNRSLVTDSLLKEVPICTPFKEAQEYAKNNNYDYTEYNRLYGEWLVELIQEVIIKRGYTNVKYIEYNTEPDYITYDFRDYKFEGAGFSWFGNNYMTVQRLAFEEYRDRIKAGDKAMREAGLRDYLKVVGPSSSHNNLDANGEYRLHWLEWAVEELNDCIDIYAAHFYFSTKNYDQDEYDKMLKRQQDLTDLIKATGKEIWQDEYNITNPDNKESRKEDGMHATNLALVTMAMYEGGCKMPMLWYLFDTKWPGNEQNAHTDGSWFEGIHRGGLIPVSYESTIPYKDYYLYCAMSSALQAGDVVYGGSSDGEGLHSILLKHTDGTYSMISVNMSWDETDVTYNFPVSLKGKRFEKIVYDPFSVIPTPEYKPLEPTATEEISGNSFISRINAYQVVVYNMK